MQIVKILNKSSNPIPSLATEGSAGFDLRAFLDEVIVLDPLERALLPTGLFMEIPRGFEGQIRPRSGMAYKKGVTVLNSPGTIDSDYRGEIKVLLINLSREPVNIENGDRIAQMVIAAHEIPDWTIVESLEETVRSSGGFGSTGTK